jgi:hypothetical protein
MEHYGGLGDAVTGSIITQVLLITKWMEAKHRWVLSIVYCTSTDCISVTYKYSVR